MRRAAERWGEWDDEVEDLGLDDDASLTLALAEAQPAARTAPARRTRAASAPKAAPRRRVRWGQLAAVTVVGYLLIVGVTSEVTLLGVSHKANALGAQATRLTATNKALRHEVALLHQRRYVDELARTELGYVSPGEVELVPKTISPGTGSSHPA